LRILARAAGDKSSRYSSSTSGSISTGPDPAQWRSVPSFLTPDTQYSSPVAWSTWFPATPRARTRVAPSVGETAARFGKPHASDPSRPAIAAVLELYIHDSFEVGHTASLAQASTQKCRRAYIDFGVDTYSARYSTRELITSSPISAVAPTGLPNTPFLVTDRRPSRSTLSTSTSPVNPGSARSI